MFARRQFVWKQQVQTAIGRVVEETVRSYWDPSNDTTKSAIANVARVQVQIRAKTEAFAVGEPELQAA